MKFHGTLEFSNSLLLPAGLPLSHPVVQALLLLLLCQLQELSLFLSLNSSVVVFAGRKLNHFPERSDEHVASAREAGDSGIAPSDISKPLNVLWCLMGSTTRCILTNAESCCQQHSCCFLAQVAWSFPSASPGGPGMIPSELNLGTDVV